MKRICFGLFSSLLLASACAGDANDTGKPPVEKTSGESAAHRVDPPGINTTTQNQVLVEILLDGKSLEPRFKNGFGSITAAKESIAITVNATDAQKENLLIGFTGEDLTASRPISGKTTAAAGNGFTLSLLRITDNGMDALISFEAEGTLVSLSTAKAVINVSGKLGYATDTENPEKWKAYKGTVTLNYPVFQAIGSSKEEFTY